MDTSVETYSGYKADEYPRRFAIHGRRLEVLDVEDRWYDPSYECFRVFADDGNTYLLKKQRAGGTWQATVHPREREGNQ